MAWLLAFAKTVLKSLSSLLLWVPRRLRLIRQEKKEAEREVIRLLEEYENSLKQQLDKETSPEKRQALEKEFEGVIAAKRGYYAKMLERTLERSGMSAYGDLVAKGELMLEPENKAKLTEAVASLDLLPPPSTAEDFMASANAKYALERYDEALADYNKALQLRPDYPDALNNRGVTYTKLERYDEALADYDRALELRPDHSKGLSNRGATYYRMERYQEALAHFNLALELEADCYNALVNRGLTYHELERYDDALADYNKAIELSPNDPDTLNNRAITYIKLERYEEAEADLKIALELKPNYAPTYYNKACLFSLMRKPEDAISYLEKAIGLDEKARQKAMTDSDFDNIRDDPRFQELIKGD